MELVQSVDRTLTILEVLANYNDGLGITDISEKVALHKSTVYRLLYTLIYKGYVVQDAETGKYKITLKLFELGSIKVESMDLLKVSKPYTKMLMKSINEVVHLVIREDNYIVYIDKVEDNNTIRMASAIGKRSPLYCTATGKAILANLPENEVLDIWNRSEVYQKTENTITDFITFKEQLKLVKEKGYALDNEENERGVKCIAAPILNRHSKVEAAISVSGPSIRITSHKVDTIASEVIKYANLISKEIGYR